MTKPFKTLDEQIEILINRNLLIHSKDKAKYLLTKNSYYSVINGYKGIFLKPKINDHDEDIFEDNTTLEDIIDIHLFDKKIRNEISFALGNVEDTISANIAYILAERFGDQQGDYLNASNYKLGRRTNSGRYERDILIYELNKICRSYEHPMKHYRETYQNIPPWIIVKGATFGTLVYIYKLFKKDEKDYLISRCLGVSIEEIDEDLKQFFSKMLDIFRRYRNWAAHGGRIYSHRVSEELPYYPPAYNKFKFDKSKYDKGQGKSDVFSLIVALSFFLKSDFNAYIHLLVGFTHTLKNYSEKNPKYYIRVLENMGLPFDYYESLSEITDLNHADFLSKINSFSLVNV
ncbi:Abi family protein [Bacillus sp. S/N-304-OC-R1]|uniref:Abi family protein n=1 Tax=Bacillus sp. S/N-304-OC-R1 TaxID=2758034 RepID=UPI001C8DE616|nr:Abi family protein [Bacillus sp. S/N-304-OC-R1]MBY0122135.1 Abi family protein [Bacillus sp. S/N-304-OC-R1]